MELSFAPISSLPISTLEAVSGSSFVQNLSDTITLSDAAVKT
jgi:hypothetical protein